MKRQAAYVGLKSQARFRCKQPAVGFQVQAACCWVSGASSLLLAAAPLEPSQKEAASHTCSSRPPGNASPSTRRCIRAHAWSSASPDRSGRSSSASSDCSHQSGREASLSVRPTQSHAMLRAAANSTSSTAQACITSYMRGAGSEKGCGCCGIPFSSMLSKDSTAVTGTQHTADTWIHEVGIKPCLK